VEGRRLCRRLYFLFENVQYERDCLSVEVAGKERVRGDRSEAEVGQFSNFVAKVGSTILFSSWLRSWE